MSEVSEAPTPPEPPSPEEFIQLFTKNQRRLFLFILSQIPHPVEAEEVLQETNVVIWSKADQFRPGSNFLAWSCQIAHFEILKQRSRRRRSRLQFSDDTPLPCRSKNQLSATTKISFASSEG